MRGRSRGIGVSEGREVGVSEIGVIKIEKEEISMCAITV